jgi:hypothetical protein
MREMSDLRRRTRRRRQQNGREQAGREQMGREQSGPRVGPQQSGRVQDGRQDRGAITAETAIVLPVLVVLLLVGLWAVGVVVANIRCVDAARDVARAVARGEPGDVARRIGERSAPPGAVVGISRDGADVRVVVDADVKLDWVLLSKLPSVEVRGQAAVQIEPGSWEDLP